MGRREAAKDRAAAFLGAQALAVETFQGRAHLLGQGDALDRADPREAIATEPEAGRAGSGGTIWFRRGIFAHRNSVAPVGILRQRITM